MVNPDRVGINQLRYREFAFGTKNMAGEGVNDFFQNFTTDGVFILIKRNMQSKLLRLIQIIHGFPWHTRVGKLIMR